jgi:nucleoside-diphosphate-sugar epimerase
MSKLAMEYMAVSLYENLPIVIARPFNYTGVGQQNYVLVPKILHHFVTRAPKINLGNTHVYREFNDVRMVAEAYRGLLNNAKPGTTVNICTGKSHCLQEILDLCSMISQHHLDIVVDPKLVRKNEAVCLSGDPTLLHSIVPNLPVYTLEDTLRWMFGEGQQF